MNYSGKQSFGFKNQYNTIFIILKVMFRYETQKQFKTESTLVILNLTYLQLLPSLLHFLFNKLFILIKMITQKYGMNNENTEF